MKKQALYEFAEAGDLDAVPQLRDNSVLQECRRIATIYRSNTLKPSINMVRIFRRCCGMQAQIKSLDELMMRERKGIIVQLESEYREAKQHEDLLSRALDEQKAEVNAMSEKMVQYNILKREAEANKELYDGLQTKLKEAQISAGLKSTNIRIVDPAMIPSTPVAAGQDPQYCPGDSRRLGRRNWTRATPRIYGQHREDSGRCGDPGASAFPGGCAGLRGQRQLR